LCAAEPIPKGLTRGANRGWRKGKPWAHINCELRASLRMFLTSTLETAIAEPEGRLYSTAEILQPKEAEWRTLTHL